MGALAAIVLPSIIAAISIFYSLIAVALFVPVLAGLYSRRVRSSTAVVGILGAVSATVATMFLTRNSGFGLISPPVIGIAVAGVLILLLRVFYPGRKPEPEYVEFR